MQRRIWLVLALTLLVLTGLYFFPISIRNFGWFFHGKIARGNFPGGALATPAWLVLLPFSILAIWKRELGGRLCVIAGVTGAIGTLTMPCAWERVNRFGLLSGTIFSAIAALLGLWLSRRPLLSAPSEEIIR